MRRRVPLAELDGEGVADVLSVLADERLVTIGEGEVEVAHEALLREWPRLRGWLEEDAQGRRLHQQLSAAAREWDAGGRDPGELYRGARLAAALDWSAATRAPSSTRSSARSSTTAVPRASAPSAACGPRSPASPRCSCSRVIAGRRRARAARQPRASRRPRPRPSGSARAPSPRTASTAPLLLARQGVALDDSVQTRGNLLAALLKSPAAIGVLRGDGEGMSAVALSPDRAHARRRRPRRQRLPLRHGARGDASPPSGRATPARGSCSSPTARTAAGSRSRTTPREATW